MGNNQPRFNVETMSGVFPGTRTQFFQRLRLRALTATLTPRLGWAQLHWYDNPIACALFVVADDPTSSATPLLHLIAPFDQLNQRLQAALAAAGWQLEACGSCHFWQAAPGQQHEQLPVGYCRWQQDASAPVALPALLAAQANLALGCSHWQAGTDDLRVAPVLATIDLAPMRKVAEVSESKLSFWSRLQRRWQRRFRPAPPATDWAEKLLERSGVGAGVESCFACHGRIANLGAIVVETPEGDKQTFSLWRCRSCYTTYLNDWTDRWERLDNLETEERYYRIAPAEGLYLLTVIDGVADAEHPGRRRERAEQRALFLRFIAERAALSHQVRQGR